jgi:hypothetical protein
MRTIFTRITGILLMVSAMIGMVASLLGILAVWKYKPALEKTIFDQTSLLISTLGTTNEALSIANDSLATAASSMDSLQNVLSAFSKSIADSKPMIDELSTMLSVEIPNTIISTQESLENSQTSAKIIDDLLRIITAIPFFPGDPYNPDVPLNVALGKVSDSLDPLPQSLTTMQRSLIDLDDNLEIADVEFELVNLEIDQMKNQLADSHNLIAEQVTRNQNLIAQLESIQEQIPASVTFFTWLTTFTLVWIITTQIGLLLQGSELASRDKPAEVYDKIASNQNRSIK